MSENSIVEVSDLRAYYKTRYGEVKAIDGVSFSVRSNEILEYVENPDVENQL